MLRAWLLCGEVGHGRLSMVWALIAIQLFVLLWLVSCSLFLLLLAELLSGDSAGLSLWRSPRAWGYRGRCEWQPVCNLACHVHESGVPLREGCNGVSKRLAATDLSDQFVPSLLEIDAAVQVLDKDDHKEIVEEQRRAKRQQVRSLLL